MTVRFKSDQHWNGKPEENYSDQDPFAKDSFQVVKGYGPPPTTNTAYTGTDSSGLFYYETSESPWQFSYYPCIYVDVLTNKSYYLLWTNKQGNTTAGSTSGPSWPNANLNLAGDWKPSALYTVGSTSSLQFQIKVPFETKITGMSIPLYNYTGNTSFTGTINGITYDSSLSKSLRFLCNKISVDPGYGKTGFTSFSEFDWTFADSGYRPSEHIPGETWVTVTVNRVSNTDTYVVPLLRKGITVPLDVRWVPGSTQESTYGDKLPLVNIYSGILGPTPTSSPNNPLITYNAWWEMGKLSSLVP